MSGGEVIVTRQARRHALDPATFDQVALADVKASLNRIPADIADRQGIMQRRRLPEPIQRLTPGARAAERQALSSRIVRRVYRLEDQI